MAFPSLKCLGNKKVPFSLPWLHIFGKELQPQFLFSDSEVAGILAVVFCLAAATGTKAAVTGEGLLRLPMFYDLLRLLPSSAIPKRVRSTDPPGWHSRAQGIWGGSDFHLLTVTQQSAAGNTSLLLEIFSTSPLT